MFELLNEHCYWPKQHLKKLQKTQNDRNRNIGQNQNQYHPTAPRQEKEIDEKKISPLYSITIEEQTVSVHFQTDAKRQVYKVEFLDMAAFKHYRKLISMGDVTALSYRPRLYHEQDTPVQMMMGMVNYTYFDW
jgi:hypothetical protein